MKNIKIYYGMCGAFKGSTIERKEKNKEVMYSPIKTWKYHQDNTFKNLTEYNDLNYGILHLVSLEGFIKRTANRDCVIERAISDMLFYYSEKNDGVFPTIEGKSILTSAIEEEKRILGKDSKVERVLLVQKDSKFVEDIVLKDKYRKASFSNVEDYMKKQEEYVKFTCSCNTIDEIVEITNAREYLKDVLGISPVE